MPKIVIDIDETTYDRIKQGDVDRLTQDLLLCAVMNGTPLEDIKAKIEEYREDEEPHLIDYRYYRNDTIDLVLDIIDGCISGKEQ